MKLLLKFLRRFSDAVLFLALMAVCALLISRTPTVQGGAVLHSANRAAGGLYAKQQAAVHYFGLSRYNEELLAENARLRAELSALKFETDSLRDSTATVASTVDTGATPSPAAPRDTTPRAPVTRTVQYTRFVYRTALVVANSVDARNNFITLARGSADGVRPGQAVVSPGGVVGKIVAVSPKYAVAISALSDAQPVSGRLAGGTLGTVTWEWGRPDRLTMAGVPQEIKVYKGDTVWTTPYSFAPPDVPIGRVERIRPVSKNATQTLILSPAADFRRLRHVYVVENTGLAERQALEDSARRLIRTPTAPRR